MARSEIQSDIGPYAVVPLWLVERVGGTASRLFVVLAAKYADREGVAWPSRTRLAKDLGVSVDTVDRAVKELVEKGALVVEHRRTAAGDPASNVYRLNFVRPGSRTGAARGSRTRAAQNHTHMEPYPTNHAAAAEAPPRDEESSPKETRPPRRRDPLFEAVASACGYDLGALTPTQRGRANRARRELAAVGASPEDVLRLAEELRRAGLTVITPQTLTAHWRPAGAAPERDPHSEGYLTPEDFGRPPGGWTREALEALGYSEWQIEDMLAG